MCEVVAVGNGSVQIMLFSSTKGLLQLNTYWCMIVLISLTTNFRAQVTIVILSFNNVGPMLEGQNNNYF